MTSTRIRATVAIGAVLGALVAAAPASALGPVSIKGTPKDDVITITATTPVSGSYTIKNHTQPFVGATQVTIDARGGDDLIVIENPAPALFGPVGGIEVRGGDGVDEVRNLGGIAVDGALDREPAAGEPAIAHTGATPQRIALDSVANVSDSVADGTWTYRGTSGTDAIAFHDVPPTGPTRCCGSAYFTDSAGVTTPTGKGTARLDTRASADVVTLSGNWPVANALVIDDGSAVAEDTVRANDYRPSQARDFNQREDLTIRAARFEASGSRDLMTTSLALDAPAIVPDDGVLDTYIDKLEINTDSEVKVRNGTGLQIGGVSDALDGVVTHGWSDVSIELPGFLPLTVAADEQVAGEYVTMRSGSIDLAGSSRGYTVALLPPDPTWTGGPVPVDVGGALDAPGTYSLSRAELDRVNASWVEVGSTNSGLLTVSAPITLRTAIDMISGAGFTGANGGSVSGIMVRFTDGSSTGRTWTVDPTSVKIGDGSPIGYGGAPSPLWLRGGSGADEFRTKASPTTGYYIEGGDPTATPGDRVVYDAEGRSVRGDFDPPDGDVNSDAVKFVSFRGVEELSILNAP